MIKLSNPYQIHPEPSIQDTWYDNTVLSVDSNRVSNTTSRYKNKRTITLVDGTTFIEFIRESMLYTPENDSDQFYYVMNTKNQRPDIVSLDLLGVSSFYWVILSDNHMVSPLQMQTQLTLRIPTISVIMNNTNLI